MSDDCFFTVILPTRNRAGLFELALKSVLAQSFQGYEIIVVDDGSSEEFKQEYQQLEAKYTSDKVQFLYQPPRPNGHGQSYSMNTGAYAAKGQYLCFLDDDDYWIDTEHLQRAHDSITVSEKLVDAYYTNQEAYYSDNIKKTENVWIEDLSSKLSSRQIDPFGTAEVDINLLLSSKGFAHLNCSIIRKALYIKIKGMDENIRYECDRDVYLRTLDASSHILYNPAFISKHHIPDPKKSDNMSTMINLYEKSIYQIVVYEKGLLLANKQEIREFCSHSLSYVHKKITMSLADQGDYKAAHKQALKGLGSKFGFKWLVYSTYLSARALTSG